MATAAARRLILRARSSRGRASQIARSSHCEDGPDVPTRQGQTFLAPRPVLRNLGLPRPPAFPSIME